MNINNINKSVLIVDLNSTSPAYTAYFCDALNSIGIKADIAGIERKKETKYLKHLKIRYINWLSLTDRLDGKVLKQIIKFIEYIINWMMVLYVAPRYKAVHIQWLPLSKFTSLEIVLLKILSRRNQNIFYTVHNLLPHDDFSNSTKRRFKRIYKMIPNLVVHTAKTKNDLYEQFNVDKDKIIVMPHGPMLNNIDILSQNKKRYSNVIGMIGFIRPYKGIEDAIKLVKQLIDEGLDIKLIIAGYGDKLYLEHIDELIDELKINSHVKRIYKYLDVDELINLVKSVRLVLAPYKKIDQSGAVLTALSLGTPVVGYKIGGLEDVIINGYNGQLVDNDENRINNLACGVKWVLNRDMKQLELNCKKSLENVSWNKAASIMRLAYEKK